jgi:DNA-binding transcriptional MerR regulator
MNYKQFLVVFKKGFKLPKILEYLDKDDFEKEEISESFKEHFNNYMNEVRFKRGIL